MKLGLTEMIEDVMARTRSAVHARVETAPVAVAVENEISIGAMLSAIEEDSLPGDGARPPAQGMAAGR
ncbi:MAG: hypothetical protein PW735_06210 [Acidobacteriaceae bacterium]|nr:hypothetical protein [Acidobacteriaceae bacterium]